MAKELLSWWLYFNFRPFQIMHLPVATALQPCNELMETLFSMLDFVSSFGLCLLSQRWLARALTIIQFHLALYGIAPGRWLKNQALNSPVPFASRLGQVLWNAMELSWHGHWKKQQQQQQLSIINPEMPWHIEWKWHSLWEINHILL